MDPRYRHDLKGMKMKQLPKAPLVATVVSLVGVGAVAWIASGHAREQPASNLSSEDTVASYAALRGPGQMLEALSARERALASQFIADGSSAEVHRVASRASFELTVIETPGRVCFVRSASNGTASIGCPDLKRLQAGTLGPSILYLGDEYAIEALVPDGTSDAALHWQDGTTQPVRITGNFLSVRVAELPVSISWTDAHGTTQKHDVEAVWRPPAP